MLTPLHLLLLAGLSLSPDVSVRPDLAYDVAGWSVHPLKPEIPRFTTIFLGLSSPEDHGTGRAVPGIAVFHNRSGIFRDHSYLKISFISMVAAATVGDRDLFGEGGEGGITAVGNYGYGDGAPFLYVKGASVDPLTFFSHYYGARAFAGKWILPWMWIRAAGGVLLYEYTPTRLTGNTFLFPPNHASYIGSVELLGRNEQTYGTFAMTDGHQIGLKIVGMARDTWARWELGEKEDRYAVSAVATAGTGIRFLDTHNLVALLRAGAGQGLDGVTKFRLGAGYPPGGYSLPIHGYFFNEVKGDGFILMNVDEGFEVARHVRFHAYLDAGYAGNRAGRLVPAIYPRAQGVLGLGAAVDIKLFGIAPVYFGYGYAPFAERRGAAGGHEVIGWLVAGF